MRQVLPSTSKLKASDEGNRKIGLAVFSKNRTEGAIDIGQRFGENKQFGIRFNGKYRQGETARKGYKEDNQEFALNTDYRGEKLRLSFDSMYNHRNTEGGRARIHEMQDPQFCHACRTERQNPACSVLAGANY